MNLASDDDGEELGDNNSNHCTCYDTEATKYYCVFSLDIGNSTYYEHANVLYELSVVNTCNARLNDHCFLFLSEKVI